MPCYQIQDGKRRKYSNKILHAYIPGNIFWSVVCGLWFVVCNSQSTPNLHLLSNLDQFISLSPQVIIGHNLLTSVLFDEFPFLRRNSDFTNLFRKMVIGRQRLVRPTLKIRAGTRSALYVRGGLQT
jgi:hypothetical protein